MILDVIINAIIEKISNIPLENPVFIYTGVGTSGSVDHNGILQLQNYHQYPPFLQNLKNTIPNLHIFIILIDPYQETPPYMVNDKNLLLESNNENIECYTNNTNNLTVYVMHLQSFSPR